MNTSMKRPEKIRICLDIPSVKSDGALRTLSLDGWSEYLQDDGKICESIEAGEMTMEKLHAARRQIARLSFEDGEIVVTPKDRDIFLISAEKATEACRNAIQLDQRIMRFESDFLLPLYHWCAKCADRVRACYIPLPGSHIQVFVVTNSPQFDFDLAEEVAALERNLAQSGWRVGVSQLPNGDDRTLATFFNPEGALEVYAKPGSASQESGKQP